MYSHCISIKTFIILVVQLEFDNFTNNMGKKEVGKKFRKSINKPSAVKGKLHTLEIFFLLTFSSTENAVLPRISALLRISAHLEVIFFENSVTVAFFFIVCGKYLSFDCI